MKVRRSETFTVATADDVVRARQKVRSWATDLGFSLVDQTKLVTAASELARNMQVYGGGGELVLEIIDSGSRLGLKMVFEDSGPGIADLERALTDGYSTGDGLGLGLGGARRLLNEFEIASKLGEGTRVTGIKWK